MMRALLADTRGATAVLTALSLASVIGFVALGIEASTGLHAKRGMQDAADSAALAGALAFRAGSTGHPAVVAQAILAQNGYTAHAGDRISIAAPLAGNPDGRVAVEISRNRVARFANLLSDKGGTVAVRAVAHLVENASGCMLALAPRGAIDIARKADLHLGDCSMLSGDGGLPPLRLAEADPYRDVVVPAAGPCRARGAIIRGVTGAAAGGRPFLFCGGLQIEAAGHLQLAPGVYVIAGGPLSVRKGGQLAGHGVTILLGAGASAQFDAGASINLAAPKSGPHAGLALASGNSSGSSSLIAGASQRIVGAIHMPAHTVRLAGSAKSPCTHIVAYRVHIVGKTRLDNDCAGTGTRPLLDRVVRLAE